MLLALFKRTVARIARGRQKKGGYRPQDLGLRPPPGQNGFTIKRSGLDKVRKVLVRNKMRQQQSYGRRASRRRLTVRLISIVAVITAFFVTGVLWGEELLMTRLQNIAFFQVARMTITGNLIVSSDKLRELSGVKLHHTSLIGLDLQEIEKKLQRLPWVAAVTVQRDFPSTLEINVVENVPLAILHNGYSKDSNQLYYIDKRGRPLQPVSPGGEIDFPVITGLYSIDDRELRSEALGEALLFIEKTQNNDPHLPAQSVSEVHLSKQGEMVVYLVEYPFPIFFGNGNTRSKYLRLVQVLKALYQKKDGKELISQVKYIHMDYMKDKVLVAQIESSS